jgi:hypothetical protein
MGPWTTLGSVHLGPAMDGQPELTGAWPPTAPVLKVAGQGVEDRETGSGNSMGR